MTTTLSVTVALALQALSNGLNAIARALHPDLPPAPLADHITVVRDTLWCRLSDTRFVITTDGGPTFVRSYRRTLLYTVLFTDTGTVILPHQYESPYAMFGRDMDGYLINTPSTDPDEVTPTFVERHPQWI